MALTARLVRVVEVLFVGLAVTYAGCSARQRVRESAPLFVKMQTKFDYSDHESYAKTGGNSVTGQGTLRHQRDGLVTCARGPWFILTQVNARHGGVLITEVTLSNNRTIPVLLTDRHLVGR